MNLFGARAIIVRQRVAAWESSSAFLFPLTTFGVVGEWRRRRRGSSEAVNEGFRSFLVWAHVDLAVLDNTNGCDSVLQQQQRKLLFLQLFLAVQIVRLQS